MSVTIDNTVQEHPAFRGVMFQEGSSVVKNHVVVPKTPSFIVQTLNNALPLKKM